MTTQPFFDEQVLQWSGESHEVEMTSLDDGIVALAIGLGVIVASFAAALLIALAMKVGQL